MAFSVAKAENEGPSGSCRRLLPVYMSSQFYWFEPVTRPQITGKRLGRIPFSILTEDNNSGIHVQCQFHPNNISSEKLSSSYRLEKYPVW